MKQSETKYKSRPKRVSTAALEKAILAVGGIKEKDERVLWVLARYKLLTGGQIRVLCYYDVSDLWAAKLQANRLGQLVEVGLLERIYSYGREACYRLSGLAIKWLAVQGLQVRPAALLLLEHDQQTAWFMVQATLESRRLGWELTWEGEIETESRARLKFAPDATGISTRADGLIHPFFLESDRNTETYNVWAKKVERYVRYFDTGSWRQRFGRDDKPREGFPAVLVVTSGPESRVRGLIKATATALRQKQVGNWYFTTRERLRPHVGSIGEGRSGPLQAPVWSVMGSTNLVSVMQGVQHG